VKQRLVQGTPLDYSNLVSVVIIYFLTHCNTVGGPTKCRTDGHHSLYVLPNAKT
jgi:hypothetical protein